MATAYPRGIRRPRKRATQRVALRLRRRRNCQISGKFRFRNLIARAAKLQLCCRNPGSFRARNPGAEFSPESGASASDFLLSISKRKARGRQRAGGAHNHSKAYRRDCAACVISCDGVWYLTIESFVVATVSCKSNGETPRNGTPAPKMRPSGGLVFRPVFQR